MTSPVPLGNPLSETPVFGSSEFIGRTRLAQNLFSRCLRRQAIVLYGGPKLGKTSMLLHLKWLIDRDREASSATPAALFLDLSDAETRKQLLGGSQPSAATILLLDNCDHLLQENRIDRLQEIITSASFAHAAVWAGARAWHDFVLDHRWTAEVRHVPLAVLLQGEAEELVKARLTANQMTAVLSTGGTHPYVLKVLGHSMLSLPGDPLSAISAAGEHLVPFFHTCRQALRQGVEEALLRHLVQESRPINPREAAMAVGLPSIKSHADALCCLGLISRWNLNEGAMLHANCPLFNAWYLKTVR
ncbi:MAG: hypothetical protein ABJB49_01885 [Nitrospirota bacterium]